MRFGFIGDMLRALLDWLYSFIPNYGIAILVFVFIIRMLLLPFDIKSRRGMKRMQDVQPKMAEIEKKYANDPERRQQKLSDLYRKEKVNPLAGCLPLLLTFPILFAMFAVMREVANEKTVAMVLEIKAQLEAGNTEYRPVFESFLWIKNVFQPDSFMSTVVPMYGDQLMAVTPYGALTQEMIDEAKLFLSTDLYATWSNAYGNTINYSAPMLFWLIEIPAVFNGLFLLPVLSAVTQFLSTKLMNLSNPTPAQKNNQQTSTQQVMKWFFPIFSLWICSTSNAGFALYWVFANVIQVIQQFAINKWLDYSESKKKLIIEEAGK